MRHRERGRRSHKYRVALRPKIRNRRVSRLATAALILGVIFASVWCARHFQGAGIREAAASRRLLDAALPRDSARSAAFRRLLDAALPRGSARSAASQRPLDAALPRGSARSAAGGFGLAAWGPLRVERAEVRGVSPVLARRIQDFLERTDPKQWGILQPYRISRSLMREFSCLESVRVKRSWSEHALEFHVTLRRPVARALRQGRSWGWLDRSGMLFAAPEGIYSQEFMPLVDIAGAAESDYAALALLLERVQRDGELPAPLERLRLRSQDEGWEGSLADGTELLWGSLSWTDMKLERLRQVLQDSRRKLDGAVTADLRNFEDGKILIRPASTRPKEGSIGGVWPSLR